MKKILNKMIIFSPLLLVTIIVVTFIYITKSLPKWPILYIFTLLNILATLQMLRSKVISKICGIICGIASGVYMWKTSLSNWKLDIELYIGVLFIVLYLFVGIYFLYPHYKMELKRKQ